MITAAYKKPVFLKEFAKGFGENNPQGIQIMSFFDGVSYARLFHEIKGVKFKKEEIRDMYSYFAAAVPSGFFNTAEFLSCASVVTGRCLTQADCSLRMFMHGSFTLMHEENAGEGIEFFFDLTPAWNHTHGGNIVLLADDNAPLFAPHAPNSLILGMKGRSYVKYVNVNARLEGRMMVYGTLK